MRVGAFLEKHGSPMDRDQKQNGKWKGAAEKELLRRGGGQRVKEKEGGGVVVGGGSEG